MHIAIHFMEEDAGKFIVRSIDLSLGTSNE
jgi:hypothetical protein